MSRILITGASGQIGSELCIALAEKYGKDAVLASDIREMADCPVDQIRLDVMDFEAFSDILEKFNITTVYHLASLLSGTSELKPALAWKLNLDPLLFLLEKAKEGKIKQLFWPSSIAVFGKGLPKYDVSQEAVLHPATIYGITKLAGEELCQYYHDKYQVDVRSIRYPGLISWKTEAGGGTTDYAVEIFYKALQNGRYTSFLTEDTALPMMYMDDAIKATIDLMEAPAENLTVATSYNVGGISFTPKQLSEAIRKILPKFEMTVEPDFRQAIADSWPASIDDSVARRDWNLEYEYDIDALTREMIDKLKSEKGL